MWVLPMMAKAKRIGIVESHEEGVVEADGRWAAVELQ
jgi:hypothetical protein